MVSKKRVSSIYLVRNYIAPEPYQPCSKVPTPSRNGFTIGAREL